MFLLFTVKFDLEDRCCLCKPKKIYVYIFSRSNHAVLALHVKIDS